MPGDWHARVSQPKYEIELEKDVFVTMRDGARLCVDIYRPRGRGKFPALLACGVGGKDMQRLPTSPRWRPMDHIRGNGLHECGEQWYFVPRGYVQVIPDIRGVGKSKGKGGEAAIARDGFELIEWMAEQPWCNGNVGMTGMSTFTLCQYLIAEEQPPHLKAISPFEGSTDRYRHGMFNGGIYNFFFNLPRSPSAKQINGKPRPASLRQFSKKELKAKIEELQRNPDILCNHHLYTATLVPGLYPDLFDRLMHPYDGPFYQGMSGQLGLKKIHIPTYAGSRWNAWAMHLPGAFDAFENVSTPEEFRKLLMVPSDNYGGMDRPFHEVQDVCLRWYDHWLRGNDTGILEEPRVLLFVQGINRWRYENEWPLKATEWTKFYLRENGRLSRQSPNNNAEEPQVFTSDPWAYPSEGFRESDSTAKADPVPKAIYETEPLRQDMEVTGPIALYWHAAIESRPVSVRSWQGSPEDGTGLLEPVSNDTDWYLKVKDIDVDGSERCVSEGWLKASHYELDPDKTKPYEPYHPHSRSLLIKPGEVILYASDIRMTSNVFLAGHKLRLEISGQDQVQCAWYRLPHMAHVTHTIYSTSRNPSYLLLPIIPRKYEGAGEPDFPPEGPFRIAKYRRP